MKRSIFKESFLMREACLKIVYTGKKSIQIIRIRKWFPLVIGIKDNVTVDRRKSRKNGHNTKGKMYIEPSMFTLKVRNWTIISIIPVNKI